MNSVLVVIDSKDKQIGSNSTSDFKINYPNNSILNKIKAYFVKSVSIPNVEYNIHGIYSFEPANNKLYIETSGGGLQPVITVPIGQYTLTQLIAYLTSSTTGLSVGLTIIQDPNTYKLTFNSTASGGIKIYARDDTSITNSTLSPLIGVLVKTPAFSNSIVADGLPSLQGNQNIYISSNRLSCGVTSLIDSRLNYLRSITTIPVNVPFGEVIHYETFDYEKDMIQSASYFNLNEIDIQLYNDFGQILDLQGNPFTMIIKAFYDP